MKKSKGPNRKRKRVLDRLSGLPEAILCHVLSFLSTKSSVATSLLSRRWRFIWTRVPSLDLDTFDNYEEKESFSSIIDSVMELHDVKALDSFRLRYSNDDQYEPSDSDEWLAYAVSRGVKVVDLELAEDVPLPRCVLTCRTVVELTLHYFDLIEMEVHLPVLKKLHIDGFWYESDESLPDLLSGCPVLEELVLERKANDDMICCNVLSSPTLKRVTLNSEKHWLPYPIASHRIVITAPALNYLCLVDSMYEHLSVEELPSLIEADIHIDNEKYKGDDVLYSRTVLEFVAMLCNVKYLKLSMVYVKVLGAAFSSWTTRFHNLTKLELKADWRFISLILENADNLQVLIVCGVGNDLKCWTEPQRVPKCLSSHLTTIKIDCFVSAQSEFEMVRYILRNAKILRRMEIHSRSLSEKARENTTENFELMREISLFEKGSEECVVIAFH